MADFRYESFRGIRPRVRPRKLANGESQVAANVRLGSGALEPWSPPGTEQALTSATIQSIFRMRNNGSPIWLESVNDVDYARGPVADDILERIYYTGEAEPRMTYIGIAAGAAPLPDDYRYLGIPAPSTAPTLVPDALPFEAPTGTVNMSSIATNYLLADVGDGNGEDIASTGVGSWRMANADTSAPANGTERALEFDVYIGLKFRVAATPDANTLTLENVSNDDYLVGPAQRAAATELFFKMDVPAANDPTYYFRVYLPNSIDVTCTAHNLEVGDIIEVTQIPTTCVVQMTQSANGPFWGTLSTDTSAPAAIRTWPADLSPIPTDSFFTRGRGLELEEIWIDNTGAASVSSFTIVGEFDWTLVARGGVDYTDILADVETRAYVFTYVSDLGEEGPPSPPSEIVTILSDATVEVTQTGTPPSTQRQIDTWRIYRANTGSVVTDFQFVAEVAIGTTMYSDSLEDIDLGEPLQTTTWDPPPAGLEGITAGPNGMTIGFVGKTIHLAEPYFPHAWPPEYKQAVEHDIVGIGVLPNGYAILTTGTPYALVGDHPRGMSLQKFEFNQACVSKRSIASTLDSVIYASPDGLCEIGSRGFSIVTRGHATKREWQAFNPSTIVGDWHDSKYIGFHSGGYFVFDPNDESIGWTTGDTFQPGGESTPALLDSDTDEGSMTNSATSFSFNVDVSAGSDRMMVIAIGVTSPEDDSFDNLTGVTVTVDGVTADFINVDLFNNDDLFNIQGASIFMAHALGTGIATTVTVEVTGIPTITVGSKPWGTYALVFSGIYQGDANGGYGVDEDFTIGTATSSPTLTVPTAALVVTDHQLNAVNLSGFSWAPPTGYAAYAQMDFGGTLRLVGITYKLDETAGDISHTLTGGTEVANIAHSIAFRAAGAAGAIAAVTDTYVDTETDELYFINDDDGEIQLFDPTPNDYSSAIELRWKSGKIKTPHPLNLGAARIVADSYPVVLNIWNDQGDNVVVDRSVTSSEVIRLPGGYLTSWFEFQVEGDDVIEVVHLAETVEELLEG